MRHLKRYCVKAHQLCMTPDCELGHKHKENSFSESYPDSRLKYNHKFTLPMESLSYENFISLSPKPPFNPDPQYPFDCVNL